MNIVFDTQTFSSQEYGGISRYFASLARELDKINGVNVHIIAPLYANAYLEELPRSLIYGFHLPQPLRGNILLRSISAAGCDILQRFIEPDIIHKTYYHPFPFTPKGAKSVVTIHDMIHEKFPEDFPSYCKIPEWKIQSIRKADHIICISENTRNDLLSMLDVDENKVTSIYHGYDPLYHYLSDKDESGPDFRTRVFSTDTPYLLFIGRRTGYKNFNAFIDAYADSEWLKYNFKVLCFGGGAFNEKELSLLEKKRISNNIKQISGSDKLLAACYQHAELFVFPSRYEGFGFPLLEAMSLNCPVAASNCSSLPEIGGDAAIYFNPLDRDSIKSVLEHLLNSPSERAKLIAKGKVRCTAFSWTDCAKNTLNVYNKALAKR